MLPSISIDKGILRHCSLVAFAESSDYFNGPEGSTMASACAAVELHLQKFCIILAESNVSIALKRLDGQPDDAKLALEQHFGRLADAKLALEPRFGRPGGFKLALEPRFGRPEGTKLALELRFGVPHGKK